MCFRATLGIVVALFVASLTVWAVEPFNRTKLAQMDAEIDQAIAEGKLPGAVLWIEHAANRYQKAYGDRALAPESEPMTKDTIFDMASLTKVMATTPAIMLLLERELVKLDEPVFTYIPEFKANGKEAITVRHLMTHVSGLAPGLPASPPWSGWMMTVTSGVPGSA